uniref:Uncharacterized protein n=1 Tax=Noccaea caerulescens TaxID=107243 RepID=A0A1J3GWF6_NOCCA
MVVTKTGRKNANRNIGHPDLDEPKRSRYRYAKSIEDNQKIIEEMQQHLLQIDKNITERKFVHEKAISGLNSNMRYGWFYNGRWTSVEDDKTFRLDCPKTMELDKLTFANNAYRDKKSVISFSYGEREINIHNLSHRMLHEVHSMDDERRLLKMLKQNKDIDSGFSLKQVEEQMWKLYRSTKWPNQISISDEEKIMRKIKELEWERDQVFVNAPSKASLWTSLPSTKDLRIQIQAMEARDEEKRKMVSQNRKMIELKERKIKKADKEIKSMRKMMEKIRIRKQRVLEIISHERSCLEKLTIL